MLIHLHLLFFQSVMIIRTCFRSDAWWVSWSQETLLLDFYSVWWFPTISPFLTYLFQSNIPIDSPSGGETTNQYGNLAKNKQTSVRLRYTKMCFVGQLWCTCHQTSSLRLIGKGWKGASKGQMTHWHQQEFVSLFNSLFGQEWQTRKKLVAGFIFCSDFKSFLPLHVQFVDPDCSSDPKKAHNQEGGL